MVDKDTTSKPPRRTRGRWLVFLIGVFIGAAAAALLPRYLEPYFGSVLAPATVVEGRVVDKESQDERIVLKVSTPDGVLLAKFTENQEDVDLLVEPGSSIRLGASRYQPFLENPTILAVRQSEDRVRPGAREEFLKEMESRLEAWDRKLAELQQKLSDASDEVAEDYAADLETLRERREAIRNELGNLKSASGDAWEELETGLTLAWAELEEALAEAEARFREAGEPESP